jgi:hypothetical protein
MNLQRQSSRYLATMNPANFQVDTGMFAISYVRLSYADMGVFVP